MLGGLGSVANVVFLFIAARLFGKGAFGLFAIAFASADMLMRAVASRLEGGGAHRDDLLGVGRLHRLDGVAGIDRALEGVG